METWGCLKNEVLRQPHLGLGSALPQILGGLVGGGGAVGGGGDDLAEGFGADVSGGVDAGEGGLGGFSGQDVTAGI